jgi:hypothetical protein
VFCSGIDQPRPVRMARGLDGASGQLPVKRFAVLVRQVGDEIRRVTECVKLRRRTIEWSSNERTCKKRRIAKQNRTTIKNVGALRGGYSSPVDAKGSLVLQRTAVCCRRLDRFGGGQRVSIAFLTLRRRNPLGWA